MSLIVAELELSRWWRVPELDCFGSFALLVAVAATSAAAQFGTEDETKAMLTKAVAALKENQGKALEMFNKGEGGFKDRDLYVFAPTPRTAC